MSQANLILTENCARSSAGDEIKGAMMEKKAKNWWDKLGEPHTAMKW